MKRTPHAWPSGSSAGRSRFCISTARTRQQRWSRAETVENSEVLTIYDDYLTQAELQRWILDADVAWNRIDAPLARQDPALLDQVRDSALIESYFPLYTTRLMRVLWDQIDATAVFSIQLYESYKHFYVLNRYLQAVEYRPITPEDVLEVRRRNLDTVVEDGIGELARYMFSEHFAAYYFLRLSRQAAEPVLREIAGYIARDEFRHTQFAYDLLEPRVAENPEARERVLRAGVEFTHLGSEVVSRVPVVEKNDVGAILTLNKRIRRLCGTSLTEFSKGMIRGSY